MLFEDLSPYRYLPDGDDQEEDRRALNIGWLEPPHPFTTGDVPDRFLVALLELCRRPVNRTRGWHFCGFCDSRTPVTVTVDDETLTLGSAEVRARSADGRIYAAPNLVYHYVETHHYRPPAEFVDAVMVAR